MASDQIDLSGKIALVTGAARGIGLATARRLAQAGAHVILTGRRAPIEAAAVLAGEGLAVTAMALDVAAFSSAAVAASAVARDHGRLDILVNNAGIVGSLAPIAASDPAEWAATIQTNLVGSFNVCRAMLELIPAGGVIVNVGSSAADAPVEAMSAYCASKAGLELFTRCLAAECQGAGIRVVGFRPGRIDTGMHAQLREARVNRLAEIDQASLGAVESPANAITFLCGNAGQEYAGRIIDLAEMR
jgi:NAD(P)-dependent dehydrogenase (short-subunit alcohol dehydrogenase family)